MSLKQRLIEEEVEFTENILDALWMLDDGTLLDGGFDMGMRGLDHRMIECAVDSDRYDDNFWDDLHDKYNVVRLVPETKFALIGKKQKLTPIQKQLLSSTDFEIERY